MNALVIGGTGPTGPHIVRGLLERGYRVTILHRGEHEVDLGEGVEHLHAELHFAEPLREALGHRTFDLVVGMYGRLRHLAEVIRGRTGRFVAVGGMPYRAFVEGDAGSRAVPVSLREDAPLFRDAGKNHFTALMTASEEVVLEAHRAGAYSATLLRFPMIYGPRQVAPREWSIVRRLLDGRSRILVPDGGLKLERRGYAENVAHALLLAVDRPEACAGEVYNVGDETVWSLREWIEGICRAVGRECSLVSVPFAVARPTRAYAGRSFHWVPDIEKIKAALGYRDPVPAAEGLGATVRWLLENPPPPGGEVEHALGDTYDYAAEDRLMADFEACVAKLRESASGGYQFRHAYAHPVAEDAGDAKLPGE